MRFTTLGGGRVSLCRRLGLRALLKDSSVLKPKKVVFDDGDEVTVEWNVKLGRLSEGYAKGGEAYGRHIRLAGGQTRSQLRNSLAHEVAHHCWKKAGLGQWLSQKNEELVIDSFVPWFIQTIRENPELHDSLFED